MYNSKETRICKVCGEELPLERFRISNRKYDKIYYRYKCKSCEMDYFRQYAEKKNKITFSDHLEILVKRQYKDIHPKRILDISNLSIDLLGTDEIFVKLMDYKNTWLSNYGRVIRLNRNKYNLLRGSYDNQEALRYSLPRNIYQNGKWIYKKVVVYAAQAVIDTFIVNEDKVNNIFIWHKDFNKHDCYYKNLYPLSQEQYRVVKNNYLKTGNDSEEFILKVINDIRYKPDDWGKKLMKSVMYGIGYHGISYVNCKDEAYKRWHWMMNRCYSKAIHELQLEYEGCTVCEEWRNFDNFKAWYDQTIIPYRTMDGKFEMDKDILFKGNRVYSPETVCFVPKVINSLFTNGKANRGSLPLGVFYEKEKRKYRAGISFMRKQTKLGTFDTAEEAFNVYKAYKEKLIKDLAEQYRDKLPDKVYMAMMEWEIEVTD